MRIETLEIYLAVVEAGLHRASRAQMLFIPTRRKYGYFVPGNRAGTAVAFPCAWDSTSQLSLQKQE